MKVRPDLFVALVLAGTVVAFGGLSGPLGGDPESKPATVLPGAREAIDAGAYPSLQAAIDALPEGGGVVRIPPGRFEISEPLVCTRDDVLIEGAGTATHIVNTSTDGKPAIILRPSEPAKGDSYVWRVMLHNFRVTGNPKSGDGIAAHRINEIFIQGVTVSNHGGHGILLDHCYEDPRISDSLITYNKKTGLHLVGCHDIVVCGNQFEENQDALRCLDGFNLCMTGNNLDDHLGDGVVIENTYGSVVAGNMIEECKGRAIVLDRDCYGIALSANVIAHNDAGGVDLLDGHGIAVSANAFTIQGQDALAIGPGSGRVTVTGNNFSDSYLGGGRFKRSENDRRAGGMVLRGTSDAVVSGNLFAGVRPRALQLDGEPSRRVLFSGNVLTDVESDHGRLEASVVTDNLESEQ